LKNTPKWKKKTIKIVLDKYEQGFELLNHEREKVKTPMMSSNNISFDTI